ncbi:MAG: hypothetical protein AB7I18_13285 [Candidatus Berkiella sp.]
MLTGPKMQDEIQSILEHYQQSTTDHLGEIDQFMRSNGLSNIKDIPKYFPDSPNIIDKGAKLYRAYLVLKGHFATVELALKQNLKNLKDADPSQLAQLLQNKTLLDTLQSQGEQRAALSLKLNTVDSKGKEEIEQQIDGIFEEVTKRPKMEQLICSYFQFNAMAQQNMQNLQTLPALLADLTQAMKASANSRAELPKKDEWDEFGDEFAEKAVTGFQIKTQTQSTISFDSEDEDPEEDWDAEFEDKIVASSSNNSPADSDDNEDWDADMDTHPAQVAQSPTSSSAKSPADSDEDTEDWDAEFEAEPIKKAPLKLPENRQNPLATSYEHKRTHSADSGPSKDKPLSPDETKEKQEKKKVKPGRSSDPD